MSGGIKLFKILSKGGGRALELYPGSDCFVIDVSLGGLWKKKRVLLTHPSHRGTIKDEVRRGDLS